MCLCAAILSVQTYAPAAEPPVPKGRRLREIVADHFPRGNVLIGGTTGSWALGKTHGIILDREFSYVTPENDFKQSTIRRRPGTWNWSRSDAWLEHIVKHKQILRMHGPISPQCSNWAKDDDRTGEELEKELKLFMEALCKRYNGKPNIKYMDVVNETVAGNGQWLMPRKGTDKWESPWVKIGRDTDPNRTPLYIRMAFEIATRHAPDIKLVYNQNTGPEEEKGWDLIKKTVLYLRKLGLRVDGIGWQAHVNTGWDHFDKLRDLIDWAHQNKLDFHITEASAWLKKGTSPEDLKAQAETYSTILAVLLEKRKGGLVTWNTWHITDAQTWNKHWHPSIFNADARAKPAYYAIQAELEKHKDK
jgi:GH35 family endo-1,4-beta-xylanase